MSYSIDAPHFYELSYTEGDHSLRIEIDLRDPVPCIAKRVIVAWEPPHANEPLSDARKEQIIERVVEFLTKVKGYPRVDIVRA